LVAEVLITTSCPGAYDRRLVVMEEAKADEAHSGGGVFVTPSLNATDGLPAMYWWSVVNRYVPAGTGTDFDPSGADR
jgi:hypothetical protein